MSVLNYKLEEVRDLFCKVIDARWIPERGPSPRVTASHGPHHGPPRALRRMGRAGEFVFLFHKELEIVF